MAGWLSRESKEMARVKRAISNSSDEARKLMETKRSVIDSRADQTSPNELIPSRLIRVKLSMSVPARAMVTYHGRTNDNASRGPVPYRFKIPSEIKTL